MPRILTTIGAGSLTAVLANRNRVTFFMPVTLHRSILFKLNLRVCAGHGDPEPDKWQQGIRQPVHPGKVSNPFAMFQLQIHPHIQKLVKAQAGKEVDPKAICFQIFPGNIEVALKWRDAPSQRSIRQHYTGCPMAYSYSFHRIMISRTLPTKDRNMPSFVTGKSVHYDRVGR